ncbi:arpA protein [Actinomadura soli]|uniref:ArpA protein n=1 Tax=Actinomadura soli TaxID=2508997 RepID=A0A5C4JF94_9ACTN|nr:arpA protein [Actinomadura soli]TMR03837.1 arpA protein [Actinomadura soli]
MGAAEALGRVSDTGRYPLTAPGRGGWNAVVSQAREELAKSGCCVLPDFIRASLRDALRTECAAIAPYAHYDVETVNAYNIDVRTPLPDDHPGRITVERGNAFVARDRIPADFIVHLLYSSGLFQRFVAACFGLPRVHELADPLSGLCLNVVNPGMEHPWHFDTNEFTVSLLTQEAEDGGVFEYCPDIRSAESENFGDVRRVLTGRGGDLVQRLTLRPGDLQLFQGRYALHRVSTVEGSTARHTAIFAYSERPGVVGSVARTRQLFGRVLPEHLAAEGRAVRVDRLLD